MSFLKYQNYKYSGFDWLGEIPSEWTLGKFRHLFRESSEKIESDVYGEMLSVSGYRGIEVKEYSDDNQKRTEENLIGYRIVHNGQLVVNTMWLNYAGLGISQLEGHVSPAYRCYWVNSRLHKPFVHHLMRSSLYVLGYTKYLTGVRPNSLQMGRDDLMNFPIVIPSLEEQKSIASFLDHEVLNIDKLVAEQGKLIALLKEKRKAVISHAVTKGLDPKVKMKDSGVEWLGEIPEHWSLSPLKKLLSIQNGSDYKNIEQADGYPVFGSGGVFAFASKYLYDGESVLLGRKGTVDKPLYVNGKFWTVDTMYWSKIINNFSAKFCYYVANTIPFGYYLTATALPSMTKGNLNDHLIAHPARDEQNAIADFLDKKLEELDKLIYAAEEIINLLVERRSALISAAVTGQIDVRNYQLKEVA